MKMHKNEVHTDVALVRRLLQTQFPHWANWPIIPIPPTGTDNAIYRLGDDLAVRLPRIDWAIGQIDKEFMWLPRLTPHLPLQIPVPVAKGAPGEGYPWRWGVYRWLNGRTPTPDQLPNPVQTAHALANFIRVLQSLDTDGAPPGHRGAPLSQRDAVTRRAIAQLPSDIDAEMALAIWETAVRTPIWERDPVWTHSDLLAGNVLMAGGEITAVIDFGGLGVGDPACDLMIAWELFAGKSRDAFREAAGADVATWARGRGHALSQAVQYIPYYLHTNPAGVSGARQRLNAIFADFKKGG